MTISAALFWVLLVGSFIGYGSVILIAGLMIWSGIDEIKRPRD